MEVYKYMKAISNLIKSLAGNWGAVAFKEGDKDYVAFVFSGDYLRSHSSTGDTGWTNLTPFGLSKAGQMVTAGDRKFFVRIGISIPPKTQAPSKPQKVGTFTESLV